MKLGIHLSTFTTSWEEDVLRYVKIASDIGYEGVEIPLVDPFEFQVKKAKKLLKENNLMCTCGTGLNPAIDISSVDKEVRIKGLEHLKKCIDICNELESDCLGGVLYAPWGMKKSRIEAVESIKYSIENLQKAAVYAKDKGVTLALEILNRYESYFLNTVKEGNKIIDEIGCENVKLHFDTFHSHIEENNLHEAIIEGGKNIYHVHFCENTRGVPGTGQIDWKSVISALRKIEYTRWITLENFVVPNCEVGKDVCIWREIEKDRYTAVKEGFEFMRKLTSE
ncbi:sugar phosphate isomerase/epimerase family protein [Haloimpatiens sp. FM7330]|uniref:sugar phosphate isomerase/epimerase family protein n=1 Tax=Haloimpatiens sp. FM7330 TaxID=3298610 RepID=UPI0036392390